MKQKAHSAKTFAAIQELLKSSLYQVDSDGTIWTKKTSYGRVLNNGHWRKINEGAPNGREYVRFSGKKLPVEQIVYQKFHSVPGTDYEVIHKDGNVSNNHFKNLGLKPKDPSPIKSKLELIDLQTRREIKLAHKLGVKTNELVAKFGLKPAQLISILKSKSASA